MLQNIKKQANKLYYLQKSKYLISMYNKMDRYILIALLISLIWGASPLIYKHLLRKYNEITIIVISGFIYFTCLLFLGIAYYDTIITDCSNMSRLDLVWFVVIALFAFFIANLLQTNILKDNSSYIVTTLIYSCPIFTLILGYLLFDISIDSYGFTGIMLIMVGILFVAANKRCNNSHEIIDFDNLNIFKKLKRFM